ncbi:hypothetical protein AVEN_237297-1 [Araneus ventricosus]|uniref:Mos1 transposase HTH domain-containing protein n=1 Tax=Araneus ventricosus TaxID=182803 RepID=A0A4Y2DNV9_ARAVE|nr:hypothetical protein AVEN_237297-1 [Araneus ventricosus]
MDVTRDEQYAALKFCFFLKKSSAEAYAMLQDAYRMPIFPCSRARRWLKEIWTLHSSDCSHGSKCQHLCCDTEGRSSNHIRRPIRKTEHFIGLS